jgi:basic membrane protein A
MTSGRRRFAAVPLALAVALLSAACDVDLGEEEPTVTTRVDPGIDFLVCQIADERGLDDHSYNQAIQRGVQRAEAYLGVDTLFREAVTADDLDAEVTSLAGRECDLIVAPDVVGNVTEVAAQNLDSRFAMVETDFQRTTPDTTTDIMDLPDGTKLTEVNFISAEAAFLAGYAAAAATTSGSVGVVQGRNSTALQVAADAFTDGVRSFNGAHDARVRATRLLVTPDPQTAVQTLARSGADIVFIATTTGKETINPTEAPEHLALVWFGENGCRALPESCSRFFTSVVNNVDNAIFDVIKNAVAGDVEQDSYFGTLANSGVGLAPFNSYSDKVPSTVRSEMAELRDRIISGERVTRSKP